MGAERNAGGCEETLEGVNSSYEQVRIAKPVSAAAKHNIIV